MAETIKCKHCMEPLIYGTSYHNGEVQIGWFHALTYSVHCSDGKKAEPSDD